MYEPYKFAVASAKASNKVKYSPTELYTHIDINIFLDQVAITKCPKPGA